MTIFTPNQSKIRFNSRVVVWFLILLGLALANIHVYSRNVSLNYSLKGLEVKLQEFQSLSAESRNQLYNILDSKNLISVASKLSLVKESRPNYMESNPVVASQ
ncbi:MAG: hypothetical protein AAB885_01145 [Patescibacteria group bacterium]